MAILRGEREDTPEESKSPQRSFRNSGKDSLPAFLFLLSVRYSFPLNEIIEYPRLYESHHNVSVLPSAPSIVKQDFETAFHFRRDFDFQTTLY